MGLLERWKLRINDWIWQWAKIINGHWAPKVEEPEMRKPKPNTIFILESGKKGKLEITTLFIIYSKNSQSYFIHH